MKAIYYVIWVVLILLSLLLASLLFRVFFDNDSVCIGLSALIGIIVAMLKDKIFAFLDRFFKDDEDSKHIEKIEQEELKEKEEIKKESESEYYDE